MQQMVKTHQAKLLHKLKLIGLHLYMVESENPHTNLDIALYLIPFKYLTSAEQELSFIATLIIQRAYLSDTPLKEILDKLWKEIGFDSISCRRWKDYFFVERVMFLLRKLEVKCRSKLDVDEKQQVA